MSSRQIRRLQLQLHNSATTGDSNDSIVPSPERPAAVFTALTDSDDDDANLTSSPRSPAPLVAAATTTATSLSSKKKNKRNKKAAPSQPPPRSHSFSSNDDDDDVLAPPPPAMPAANPQAPPVLRLDPTHLNPDLEITRKLGVRFSHTGHKSKKCLLTTPEASWPAPPSLASGAGCNMVCVNGQFSYRASPGYKAAQAHFRAMVETYDPLMIRDMLAQHPFHVDALLQMYDFFVSTEQNEQASACLRRALFTLECWMSPAFKRSLGSARLVPFGLAPDALRRDDGDDAGLNGALIRALTLSMRLAGRRDCFEAALELCRLGLSLDPMCDPALFCLCLDYYALKAKQSTWLHENRKIANWDPDVLPNAAYARALACPTGPEADARLAQAVRRFPGLAALLLSGEDSWPHTHIPNDPVMDRLCRLAWTRQQGLWKDKELAWLRRVAGSLGDLPRLDDLPMHARTVQEYYARGVLSDFSDQVALLPRDEPPPPPPEPVEPGVLQGLIDFIAQTLPWGRQEQAGGRDID